MVPVAVTIFNEEVERAIEQLSELSLTGEVAEVLTNVIHGLGLAQTQAFEALEEEKTTQRTAIPRVVRI